MYRELFGVIKTSNIYVKNIYCVYTVKKKIVKNTVNPRVTFCPLNGAVKINAICCVLSLTSGLLCTVQDSKSYLQKQYFGIM